MYEYTDKVIKHMNKRFIALFSQAKTRLLAFDEMNVLEELTLINQLYEELYKISRQCFYKICMYYLDDEFLDLFYVDEILESYNPTTGYRFDTESERKKSRFYERIVSQPNDKVRIVDDNLRHWSRMCQEYADICTDEAWIDRLRNEGYTMVQWHTMEDEKVCVECMPLDGKIFSIDYIPDKHWGCRCYVTGVS